MANRWLHLKTVADSSPLSNTETVSVTLSQNPNYNFYPSVTNFGSISDPGDPNPSGPNGWNAATETFTESGLVNGDPTFATDLLSRLRYNAPQLPNGQGFATQASIVVADGNNLGDVVCDATPITIGVVSPPAIADTVADQPVRSGNTIKPFAIVNVTTPIFDIASINYDYNPTDTVTIAVTDGGQATDADGLLTGAGLSKSGYKRFHGIPPVCGRAACTKRQPQPLPELTFRGRDVTHSAVRLQVHCVMWR